MRNVFIAKDDVVLERYIRTARRQMFGYRPRVKRRFGKIKRYLFFEDTPRAENRFVLGSLAEEDIEPERQQDLDRAIKEALESKSGKETLEKQDHNSPPAKP